MEAKVMSDKKIAEALNKFYGRVIYREESIMPSNRAIAQAQAELSFKAGQHTGRKEVVAWLKNYVPMFCRDDKKLQAKLKSWGLSEEKE